MTLEGNYLERVYSGILGKLIGVYLGRPFENWTYERILSELGQINYYVHERLEVPLVVTDDDVAGTFTFIRALEDYELSKNVTSQQIGHAWMNYLIEDRSVLWWGGNGNSTEHTAWLNLKHGIDAPASGSIFTNGLTVAEQIGAQIFIDGWALVAPGQPALAAELAQKAGSVSHDGESVHAAMLWAAMEAEAFISSDVNHLIETGLSQIPTNCQIARLIADIRFWNKSLPDWQDCRQKISDNYGYDKYAGNCHVMPNHALMIMALLYAPNDFSMGQMIVNTSGWDTDCNAGNLGCLHGIMLGLDGLQTNRDWRGPIGDRMLISSADGGNAINDAVRMSYYVANLGRALAGLAPLEAPKNGARFHFSLPGSTQGFQIANYGGEKSFGKVSNTTHEGAKVLEISFDEVEGMSSVVATTPTFASSDVKNMRTYELMATPTLYSGQNLSAELLSPVDNTTDLDVSLRIRHYGKDNDLIDVDSNVTTLAPGDSYSFNWVLPDTSAQPIAEVGVVVRSKKQKSSGRILLDRLSWSGAPKLRLVRPNVPGDFWHRAWVNGVDLFSERKFKEDFRISQQRGEGIIIHGTRQWTDYTVSADISLHNGSYVGLAARVQGLKRFYAVRVMRTGQLQLVRTCDRSVEVLASAEFKVELDQRINVALKVVGTKVSAQANSVSVSFNDSSHMQIKDGGIGLIVADGAASALSFEVSKAA